MTQLRAKIQKVGKDAGLPLRPEPAPLQYEPGEIVVVEPKAKEEKKPKKKKRRKKRQ